MALGNNPTANEVVKAVKDLETNKQDTLVSGTNIKTINNESILGSGNITIQGGGGSATDVQVDSTSITSQGVANLVTKNANYNASTNKLVTESDISTKMDKYNPTGTGSLAVGNTVTASGTNSAAVGKNNTASGPYSFAIGYGVQATGADAVAEGSYTRTTGYYSHSAGLYTIASRKNQFVFGQYNIEDTGGTNATTNGNYVEIVGNGTADNARSNARTLDWSGNEELAGNIIIKGGKIGDGNNATYKIALPSTSGWTADKTFATTDQIPTATSQLTNDSGFLTQHQDISGKADRGYLTNADLYDADLPSGIYGIDVATASNLPTEVTSAAGYTVATFIKPDINSDEYVGPLFLIASKDAGGTETFIFDEGQDGWLKIAQDGKVVHLTGNESIAGTKNFTGTFKINGGTISYNSSTDTFTI